LFSKLVLFIIVPRDLPVHYCALCVIQKVHFILNSCFASMLISLGPQNECYNEVAVYCHFLL